MNKKQVLYLFMFIIIIILTSCTRKITHSSAPTMSQVNEFISKNSINALSIKETSDFTIILYESELEFGHYVLYIGQNNKLSSSYVRATGHSKSSLVSLGGVASGKTPFVTVIINDEAMLQKAKEIEITFLDGTVVREPISCKGTIVLHHNEENKEPASYLKLIIYDKDMSKLYET